MFTAIMNDYYTDNGNLFARIFCNRDLPDFVRDSIETEKTAAIHDEGFADEIHRRLPIHSAADTYISAAYFAKQAADEQPDKGVVHKLLKAADLYGIRSEVDEIMAYAGSLREKVAELETPKMAEFEFESGVTGIAKIRGCGPDAVQKAAEFVLSNYRSMPAANIQKAAAVLIEAAEENGTVVDEMFGKFAGPLGNMMSGALANPLGTAGAWAAGKLNGGQQSSAPISGAGFASMLPSDFQRPSSSRFRGIGQLAGTPTPAPAATKSPTPPAATPSSTPPPVAPNIPTIKSLPSPNPAPLDLKGVPRSDAMSNAISHFGAADPNMTTPPAPKPLVKDMKGAPGGGPALQQGSLRDTQKRGSFRPDPDHIAQQKAIRIGAIQDSLERKTAAEEIAGINDAVALEGFDQKYKIAGRYSGNLDHPCLVFHTLPPEEPREWSLIEKIANDLTVNGTHGIAYHAIEAALGTERASSLFKAGALPSADEVTSVTPYLANQI